MRCYLIATFDYKFNLVRVSPHAEQKVAVSDETSVAGRPGLVDQAQFARAAVAIDQACQALADPTSDQQQVLSAATVIAKHTSALCNACRVASGKTGEPQAKRHFVQAAKDVANSTAALVKEIKALDTDYSESNRGRCAAATGPLQEAVRSLCQFADSPQFSAVPARISPQARHSQAPILQSGRNIISGSCAMLESAKALAVTPDARPQWQALAQHSKTVSDSIKALLGDVSINERNNCFQVSYCEPLVSATVGAVSNMTSSSSSGELLEHARTVLETLALVTQASAQAAGNPNGRLLYAPLALYVVTVFTAPDTDVEIPTLFAVNAHRNVDAQSQLCRAALTELLDCARALSTQRGAVGPLLDALARSMCKLTPSSEPPREASAHDARFCSTQGSRSHRKWLPREAAGSALSGNPALLLRDQDKISKYYMLKRNTVYRWLERWQQEGALSNHVSFGRPRSTTRRQDMNIINQAREGELVEITGRMNAVDYKEILEESFLPTAQVFYPNEHITFMQDNSSVHNARLVQGWINDHRDELTRIKMPAKSPDLNPIENLWGKMVQEWDGNQCRTKDALRRHALNVWESFRGRNVCENLVGSMRRRLQAVLNAEGSYTKRSAQCLLFAQDGRAKLEVNSLYCYGNTVKCIESIDVLSLVGSYDETDSFVDYQTRMVGVAKEIARLAMDMTAKSVTDASRLVVLGNELCLKYEQLAQDSVGASATTPNADVANR
ncbi:hypothetical protein MSG28_015209 [Choristoneura fumiferana]|uniref:Uncharacterized protein n=1 Tax=Choristoneura fumiferana TaxID=7141 RepID=A0ACC0KZA6_CHOFU|nr:hypothetical protein MSG28_015209 [Choristoneura fumiferana]